VCCRHRMFVLRKILQTNRMSMVLASCTVTPCGLLGGIQRFGQRAASIFSVCPTFNPEYGGSTLLRHQYLLRRPYGARIHNTNKCIWIHSILNTSVHTSLTPETHQWFVLVMHKMCFQGGINAPLKYYLDTFRAKNKTKYIKIATYWYWNNFEARFFNLLHWWKFVHSVFCLTTGPKSPPKRCLHIVRSRASSFKWEYPLLSLRSSSSFLRLLPRLLATSISPFIFPSITQVK